MAAMELINAVGTGQGAPLLAWCTSAEGEQLRLVLHADEACMARLLAEGEHLQGLEPSAVNRRYRDALLGRLPDGGPELVGLLDLARHAAAPVRLERAVAHGRPVLLLTARI
jgi:hypothetical protein